MVELSEPRRYGPRRLSSLFPDDSGLTEEQGNLWIQGVTAMSGAVERGMLFAAIPGTKRDGAEFIPEALRRGAAAILAGQQPFPVQPDVPVLRFDEPRHALAMVAARFYARQPRTVAAVTGTNGKTSVSVFLRQIWAAAGFRAASLGTIGLITPDGKAESGLTTPDPIKLHEIMGDLAGNEVTHLALEASSQGLHQHRLDGVRLSAGAFTNLSRDHLDYHASLESYLDAKLILFRELLPKGAAGVADADQPEAGIVQAIAKERGLDFHSVGRRGETLRLISATRMSDGSRLLVDAGGARHYVSLPLVGQFQVSNALVAAGLAITTGMEVATALGALAGLKGASGRLELVGTHPSGALVFVDYAHTPDAIATALQALRPHATHALVVVFGAGGDRDPGKRPLMGEAAGKHADRVIVTDDNPRSENPAKIRRAVLEGVPTAEEIGDRANAIRSAVQRLRAGDILLIAGKGHETGQQVGKQVLPFSDQDEARAALSAIGGVV